MTKLQEIAKIAVALETKTKVPAKMLIAQWAVESSWGTKPVGNFNCFGIKKAARHTMSAQTHTREVINGKSVRQVLEFADYPSLEAACADYAWLISHGGPYSTAWGEFQANGDVDRLIRGVARVYATDPKYAELVSQIACQSNVLDAIRQPKPEGDDAR